MEISLHGIGADKITCFTAFSILSEIAQNAPAQFNNHIEKFLQRIPTGVFHADPGVQHATLRSLKVSKSNISTAGIFKICAKKNNSLYELFLFQSHTTVSLPYFAGSVLVLILMSMTAAGCNSSTKCS